MLALVLLLWAGQAPDSALVASFVTLRSAGARFRQDLANASAQLVLSRARRALEIGCDGVVSSGLEVRELRENVGDKLIVVTPGIRPVSNTIDDQKRTVNVQEAFENGTDYIVVGRPIKNAPDPRAAAEQIQETIAGIFPLK